MRKTLISLLLAFSPLSARAQMMTKIGAVAAVRGHVLAFPPAAGRAVGTVMSGGETVFLKEKITTDAQGHLQVLLLDETVFTIGPNARMVMDEFIYDPATNAGKVSANITKGIFRFVSGKIAHAQPSNMRVQLPVGTIGIHGTDVSGKIGEDGAPTLVAVNSGAATVSNGAGKVDVPAGFATKILGGGAPSAAFVPSAAELDSIRLTPPPPNGSKKHYRTGDGLDSSADDLTQTDYRHVDASVLDAQYQAAWSQVIDQISYWDEVQSIPTGVATFAGNGAFTTQSIAGAPCAGACTGTWNYNVKVNFATRLILSNAAITAPGISDSGAPVPFVYDGRAGQARFGFRSGPAEYNWFFANKDGIPAKQMLGSALYDDGAGTKGLGTPIITTR